jgi:hypothetical protein
VFSTLSSPCFGVKTVYNYEHCSHSLRAYNYQNYLTKRTLLELRINLFSYRFNGGVDDNFSHICMASVFTLKLIAYPDIHQFPMYLLMKNIMCSIVKIDKM